MTICFLPLESGSILWYFPINGRNHGSYIAIHARCSSSYTNGKRHKIVIIFDALCNMLKVVSKRVVRPHTHLIDAKWKFDTWIKPCPLKCRWEIFVAVIFGSKPLRRVHANENPENFLLFSFKCVHAKFELYKVFMQFRSFFRLN